MCAGFWRSYCSLPLNPLFGSPYLLPKASCILEKTYIPLVNSDGFFSIEFILNRYFYVDSFLTFPGIAFLCPQFFEDYTDLAKVTMPCFRTMNNYNAWNGDIP